MVEVLWNLMIFSIQKPTLYITRRTVNGFYMWRCTTKMFVVSHVLRVVFVSVAMRVSWQTGCSSPTLPLDRFYDWSIYVRPFL